MTYTVTDIATNPDGTLDPQGVCLLLLEYKTRIEKLEAVIRSLKQRDLFEKQNGA